MYHLIKYLAWSGDGCWLDIPICLMEPKKCLSTSSFSLEVNMYFMSYWVCSTSYNWSKDWRDTMSPFWKGYKLFLFPTLSEFAVCKISPMTLIYSDELLSYANLDTLFYMLFLNWTNKTIYQLKRWICLWHPSLNDCWIGSPSNSYFKCLSHAHALKWELHMFECEGLKLPLLQNFTQSFLTH